MTQQGSITTPQVRDIGQLVELPDATNTFDLMEENLQRFVTQVMIFLGRHQEVYVFHKAPGGIWKLRDDGTVFRGFAQVEHPEKKYLSGDRDLHIVFGIEGMTTRYTSPNLRFDGAPKFAFLKDKKTDELGYMVQIGGLYLASAGFGNNPWFNRNEEIYVARK